MAQVLSRVARIPRLSRFGWLMGLYAENFDRLTRLFEPADLVAGRYFSCIGMLPALIFLKSRVSRTIPNVSESFPYVLMSWNRIAISLKPQQAEQLDVLYRQSLPIRRRLRGS